MSKSGTPRVFVTLAAPSLEAMESAVQKLVGIPLGYEVRLDYLQSYTNLELELHQMLQRLHSPQVIATCRRSEAGGFFQGSVEEQTAILCSAVRAGCAWVDVEDTSVEHAGPAWLRTFRPAKVIVSHHNHRQTKSLGPTYRKLARWPTQVAKIACHARQLSDNLQVLRLLSVYRHRTPKLVALAMGASGVPSRILALRWGSLFTYAAPGNHLAAVPGQISAEAMRTTYRTERLDHRTHLYGVVGSHASISLSPAMQNAAFQAKHVNAVFLPCETGQLGDFLKFARELELRGFAVTMPFKRGILKALSWADPLALRIGACNTVVVQKGNWMGWNTDAAAVVEVLSKRLRVQGSRVLILGAGGAARAAAYALQAEGAEVIIAARRDSSARQLARRISAQYVNWEGANGLEVDAVINATPVGMPPQTDAVPVDLARLRVRVVFDMVYYPLETRFLAEARSRGLIVISGIEMLVAQGARQFELWTSLSAPRALMEQAVLHALDNSSSG